MGLEFINGRPCIIFWPSINELNDRVADGTCLTCGFTVGREGYGEVTFLGETDVYGLNLDQIGKY